MFHGLLRCFVGFDSVCRMCHNLDFGVLDATSRSQGDGRQVMPICADTSQTDLASATQGGELHLPCCTMSIISETDNGACLQQPDLGAWGV